ncbi:hypothetical protein HS041_03395 [Planomonospora sp. ID67723]|uniref:hypothetical protein n=1 Tax=Planomonospora sp. ID67723 TaxID=2738134 RepID=UPI0018C40B8B|nr:hypothetical protein [Planomonospora sp. ID67723]MBG0826819.1 hypothetical protein [Planomonospora sp. ID67723]
MSILVVLHAGAAAIVAAQSSAGARLGGAGALIGYGLLGLFLLGFLVSGYHILQTIRPTLRPPAVRSRYGITGVTRFPSPPAADDLPARTAEARAMAELLARIAERKYRHVFRAVPWAGLMLISVISWTVLVAAWR